ncbi:MAG: TIR domain-containing protein [Candidatus Thiothrix sulfatifontis]|nr:MAG: TIR domain-containing protein [Candidatus Thiothrix sulfatifontis]
MKIFIAYPNNLLRDKANLLSSKLRGHQYQHFIDFNSIPIGAGWDKTIRDNIAKSNVYIILWQKGIDYDKYVNDELNLILDQKNNYPNKKIIPVIFPSDSDELSVNNENDFNPFLELQCIEVNQEDINNQRWLNLVVNYLQKVDSKLNKIVEWIHKKWLILISIVTVLLGLVFSVYHFFPEIKKFITDISDSNHKKADFFCNQLEDTNFKLINTYTLTSKDNYEIETYGGTWSVSGMDRCELDSNNSTNNNLFLIEGTGTSEHYFYYVRGNEKYKVGKSSNTHPDYIKFNTGQSFIQGYISLIRSFKSPPSSDLECDKDYIGKLTGEWAKRDLPNCEVVKEKYKALNNPAQVVKNCNSTMTKFDSKIYLFHVCSKDDGGYYYRILEQK